MCNGEKNLNMDTSLVCGEISLRHWGQVYYVQWGEKPKYGYFIGLW